MRITTRSTDRRMPLNAALREHIVRSLRFALGPASSRVSAVSVAVGDENGPRGGEDKYCSMRAEVSGLKPVFVRERHLDLYAAISLAAACLDRALRRTLRRGSRIDRRVGALPASVASSLSNGGMS